MSEHALLLIFINLFFIRSFALKDYIHFGIVNYLFATPGVQAIADIVDPVVYMDRYTMPVWNIIACGDEFTLPDSPRFWWSKLPGEKHLRAVPNAEHSMACCALDLVADIISFYQMLVNNVPRPTLDFQLTQAGASGQASITVNTVSLLFFARSLKNLALTILFPFLFAAQERCRSQREHVVGRDGTAASRLSPCDVL